MTERFHIETDGVYEYANKLSWVELCKKLNDYEETRLRKNREIKKFKDREDRYQRVIGGVMAFIELRLNDELWWDWNDE